MTDVLVIGAVAAGSFLLRTSFIALAGNREVPAALERLFPHIKPAVMAALLVATLGNPQDVGPAHIAGILTAAVVARSGKGLIAVMASGMAAFHLVATTF